VRSLIPVAATLILACSGAIPTPPVISSAPETRPSPSAVVTVRPTPAPTTTASPVDEQLVRTVVDFARAPSARGLAAIPFAEKVKLGLGDRIIAERASAEFAQADAWLLRADIFRARYGPFSLLEFLAKTGPTAISVGPHPHCASPPMPPPPEFASSRRLSVQPTGIDTCLLWWTVDLFVSPAGRIQAITLDLWDP
jgi:hypothetical protein